MVNSMELDSYRHSCPKKKFHRRDAKDAEKPVFYLTVRGRQIKGLLLLWDRVLNSLHSLQRIPVFWSKGIRFLIQSPSPDWIRKKSHSALGGESDILERHEFKSQNLLLTSLR